MHCFLVRLFTNLVLFAGSTSASPRRFHPFSAAIDSLAESGDSSLQRLSLLCPVAFLRWSLLRFCDEDGSSIQEEGGNIVHELVVLERISGAGNALSQHTDNWNSSSKDLDRDTVSRRSFGSPKGALQHRVAMQHAIPIVSKEGADDTWT
ncbi:hypothetical protein DY000_02026609 [Brassica cretica]|uniref:Secreted protein n=1 Tax=Brassica cretica TaxID=69181 RepID=A0ABQ7EAN3_BRACR|nr:hypothetical protein DY000_02026609 [Brassica cretica]